MYPNLWSRRKRGVICFSCNRKLGRICRTSSKLALVVLKALDKLWLHKLSWSIRQLQRKVNQINNRNKRSPKLLLITSLKFGLVLHKQLRLILKCRDLCNIWGITTDIGFNTAAKKRHSLLIKWLMVKGSYYTGRKNMNLLSWLLLMQVNALSTMWQCTKNNF